MTIHKGSHNTEAGPIKSILLGIGGFFAIGSIIAAVTGNSFDGIGGMFLFGAFLTGVGFLIPDKNVVKW